MEAKTKLGTFEIDEKEIILFKNGLPGFENLRRFCLISRADTEPIKWLVSLEDERVALPVVDPWIILGDYSFELNKETLGKLENPTKDRTLVMVVIDLHSENVSANMAAPIVINLDKGVGEQIILEDERYSIRHPLKGGK
ncbi:flagellar assembly protein FliW [Mesoaciditoga lauensis]|uniref:flagellar assembly protein FliW n=1 Tax=Mesoaciditoga lauensis TaxID=1495039 RepID=UPI0005626631|nr:flagellar assembly protein FliW [Mesoaciditoga lauensis]